MAWRPASPAPASIEAASGQHPGIMRQDNRGNSAILPHCFGGICWAFHGLEYLTRWQGFGIGIHEPAGQPRHHGGHQFRRSASAPETGRAWHHPGQGRRLGGAAVGFRDPGQSGRGLCGSPALRPSLRLSRVLWPFAVVPAGVRRFIQEKGAFSRCPSAWIEKAAQRVSACARDNIIKYLKPPFLRLNRATILGGACHDIRGCVP